MNEYDEGFLEAEKDASDELAGKLKDMKFDEQALLQLAPEGPERDTLRTLVESVRKAKDAKQAKEAWAEFGKVAGKGLLKVVKKAVMG